jgi:hypothetical protein
MRLCFLLLFLCVCHSSNAQLFLLSEGGALDPVFSLRASFNDGKLWPSVKLAEGYNLSEKSFEALRVKYVKYFPDDLLVKSLVLTTNQEEKSLVRWTLGRINPGKTVTILGQLIVSFKGVDRVLGKPLISGIQLKSPVEVQPLDAKMIQKMYADEVKFRKTLPPTPEPPPLPGH